MSNQCMAWPTRTASRLGVGQRDVFRAARPPNAPGHRPPQFGQHRRVGLHRGHLGAEAGSASRSACRFRPPGRRLAAAARLPDRLQRPADGGLGIAGPVLGVGGRGGPERRAVPQPVAASASLSARFGLSGPVCSLTPASLFGRVPGVVGGPGRRRSRPGGCRPRSTSWPMVSSRVRPMGVRSYSTRGGMTGMDGPVTMPSRSSPRSVTVSILAVMPSIAAVQFAEPHGALAEQVDHVHRPLVADALQDLARAAAR